MVTGWQLVSAREIPRSPAPTWYPVIYARPFERGIDDGGLAYYHKGDVWVWVSTNAHKSASWEDAHQDAIELMRDADAKRNPP